MSPARRKAIELLVAEQSSGIPMSDPEVPWRLVEELLQALDDAARESSFVMGPYGPEFCS